MAVSFIGGGNRRKPPTCHKSLTIFITWCCIEYTSPWTGFELTTLVVLSTDYTGSCKSYYRAMTTMQASTLTYFSTCPFGQLTKKSTCPTQSFSCPKKLIKITKTRVIIQASHYFQIRGRSDFSFRELTGRSGRQQREVRRLLGEVNCD